MKEDIRHVLVPAARVVRWFDNFAERHGAVDLSVADGALVATAVDGSTATARLPFDAPYDGPAVASELATAVATPSRWGVLLVRKGGFAVARMSGSDMVEHKIGQRHVQGRTKAGGQSQQRFARRRDNQARVAYEAAADHAARILARDLEALVTGGDHDAVDAVLADPRLRGLVARRTGPWLPVGDPKRLVLDQAVLDARSVRVEVRNVS